jgi:hypothetical protein
VATVSVIVVRETMRGSSTIWINSFGELRTIWDCLVMQHSHNSIHACMSTRLHYSRLHVEDSSARFSLELACSLCAECPTTLRRRRCRISLRSSWRRCSSCRINRRFSTLTSKAARLARLKRFFACRTTPVPFKGPALLRALDGPRFVRVPSSAYCMLQPVSVEHVENEQKSKPTESVE